MTHWNSKVTAGGLAVVAMATVLVTTMRPAGAEPGGGVSIGSTNIRVVGGPPAYPFCLEANAVQITLTNTGTFSAVPSGANGGLYAGTTTATFSTPSFWFGPAGTFNDNMCTIPAAVAGTLTVSTGTPTVGRTVSCSGAAVYSRVNTNAEIASTDANCVVNGAAALSSALVFVGSQQPCLWEFGSPEPCGTIPEWVGTYTQGDEVVGTSVESCNAGEYNPDCMGDADAGAEVEGPDDNSYLYGGGDSYLGVPIERLAAIEKILAGTAQDPQTFWDSLTEGEQRAVFYDQTGGSGELASADQASEVGQNRLASVSCRTKTYTKTMRSLVFRTVLYRYNQDVSWCWDGTVISSPSYYPYATSTAFPWQFTGVESKNSTALPSSSAPTTYEATSVGVFSYGFTMRGSPLKVENRPYIKQTVTGTGHYTASGAAK